MIRAIKISIPKFIENYLPVHKRTPLRLVFLKTLLSVFETIAAEYNTWAEQSITRAYVTGETMSIEWYLNLICTGGGTDIYIDTAGVSGVPVGIETLPGEVGVYVAAGIEATELGSYGAIPLMYESAVFGFASFIVYVPTGLAIWVDTVASITNQYRSAGKTFKIVLY